MHVGVLPLHERSVEIIRAGQAESGAYSAAPTFPVYRDYCWFRDGSFIAEAMSRVGEAESAERFFDWCAAVVRADPRGPWDTRHRLDGAHDPVDWWPHRQYDGLGLWVWAMRNHVALRYHRHADDEYYGGGEWPVLAGLVGWARCLRGLEASAQLAWTEAQAADDGALPEQSGDRLLRPECYAPWVERWGPPASPLLWSHAMYLILRDALGA